MTEIPRHWPPPYRVRRSTRAKHVQLQYGPSKGLEVVLPARARKVDINELLESHRSWVERKLNSAQAAGHVPADLATAASIPPLPKSIELLAVEQHKQICYQLDGSIVGRCKPKLVENGSELLLSGYHSREQALALLTNWLREQAKQVLPPWLAALSGKVGLSYRSVGIRGQKTLWGSCSSQKRISLNFKLLFLPEALVEHVLLHELCHLRYLNHSPKFWAFLSRFDPNTLAHRREVRDIERLVPNWLES